MTDALNLAEIANEVDGEEAAQQAVREKYGPAARLERSTMGIAPDSAGNHPFSYNALRFARGQEGSQAWERHVHDPLAAARAALSDRQTQWRYLENQGRNANRCVTEYWLDYPPTDKLHAELRDQQVRYIRLINGG